MKIKHTTLILVFIILMFVADGFNAYLKASGAQFFRVSIFVRLAAEFFFLWLLSRKRQSQYIFAVLLFFFGIFALGTLAALPTYSEYAVFGNFAMINKMLFVFICWETFRRYFSTPRQRRRLFSLFEAIILIQAGVIILSTIFHWDVFQSYGPDHSRFGYKGLMPAQNETAAFFVIAFFYYLWKISHLRRGILPLVITTVAALATGTRVTLIPAALLVLYSAYHVARRRVRVVHLRLLAMLLVVGAAGWVRREQLLASLEGSIEYFAYHIPLGAAQSEFSQPVLFFLGARLSKTGGFLSESLARFNWVNYLVGGQDLVRHTFESDLGDVFFRLGLIGGFAFWLLYLRVLSGGLRGRPLRYLFTVVWLCVAVVAGHLVFSAVNGAYLAILLLAFNSTEYLRPSQRQLLAPRPPSLTVGKQGGPPTHDPAASR